MTTLDFRCKNGQHPFIIEQWIFNGQKSQLMFKLLTENKSSVSVGNLRTVTVSWCLGQIRSKFIEKKKDKIHSRCSCLKMIREAERRFIDLTVIRWLVDLFNVRR